MAYRCRSLDIFEGKKSGKEVEWHRSGGRVPERAACVSRATARSDYSSRGGITCHRGLCCRSKLATRAVSFCLQVAPQRREANGGSYLRAKNTGRCLGAHCDSCSRTLVRRAGRTRPPVRIV